MTQAVQAEIVAAFVDERNGGNLAGVVLDRTDLSEDQMQEVARRLALSETAFVRSMPDGFHVDFFTPNKRVPDCGHATVAAFGVLSARNRIAEASTVKHTVNGPRAMRVDEAGVFMQQLPAKYTSVSNPAAVLSSLGLPDARALVSPPVVARHDVGFLIVPVKEAQMLAALVPDMEKIAAVSEQLDVIGYYVFAAGGEGVDATVRMFAPSFGIPEESATGMAAGLLTAYLYDQAGKKQTSFVIEQGLHMTPASPSLIRTRPVVQSGAIEQVWVGGRASVRETREIAL